MSTLTIAALVVAYLVIGALSAALAFYLEPEDDEEAMVGWVLGFLVFWPVLAPGQGAFMFAREASRRGRQRKERIAIARRQYEKEQSEIDRIIAEQKL